MKHIILILTLILGISFGEKPVCLNQNSPGEDQPRYAVGDTISIADQLLEFNVCYGDYPSDTFRLSDLNGLLNGGNYQVIAMRINASW